MYIVYYRVYVNIYWKWILIQIYIQITGDVFSCIYYIISLFHEVGKNYRRTKFVVSSFCVLFPDVITVSD